MDVLSPSRPVPVGATREASGQRVPRVRAKVTNDPAFLPGAVGHRALDRRRRDLVRMFLAELPGAGDLVLVAVRKAAELTVAAEMARAAVLNGGACAADLDMLVKLEGESRRAVRALGIKVNFARPHVPLREQLEAEAEEDEAA